MNGMVRNAALAIGAMAATLGLIAPLPGMSLCPQRLVERPACAPDHTFEGGSCHTRPDWLGLRAHCPIDRCHVCTSSETLDSARGVCVSREVTEPVGRPACAPDHTFEGGSCHTRPDWLGLRAHCSIDRCHVCTAEEILDPVNGLCCPR